MRTEYDVVLGSFTPDLTDVSSIRSVNGTNPNCHDPFHPAHARYVVDCTVPKDGHVGRFPAHFCVKVVGRTMDTNIEMVIRICSLETMDNSCGVFRYEDDILRGCILTCNNDGCNEAPPPLHNSPALIVTLVFLLACLPQQSALNEALMVSGLRVSRGSVPA
ncbi:hypothetical protein HPB48_015041 [Haemaphysalis longicornis]|uniref:Protein quiver n=1 Tax=Haemaphysalis longicornis TaxID=44386 RepID=A0A9J6FLI8_HAELO|nr:hypothetical protein HPB48_015041 [Haemaphysalis longicornis]